MCVFDFRPKVGQGFILDPQMCGDYNFSPVQAIHRSNQNSFLIKIQGVRCKKAKAGLDPVEIGSRWVMGLKVEPALHKAI